MLSRRSAPQAIAWFVDLHHGKQLDLNPRYQRRSVWNLDYKQYFIDTVLRNYPSPAIFLDVEIGRQTRTIYHVVDGKQRLSAILEFLQDEFTTAERYSDPGVGRKYYSQFSEEMKDHFLRYLVPVEYLEGTAPAELQQAFDRLNRNVAKLNDQELRHARFSGAFISLMEALADDPFWKQIGVITNTRIRRMLDVEYVSEIFVLTMKGIQEGKDILDELYAQYDEEIPEVELHRDRYEKCKALVAELWPKFTTTRFSNLADFYSLWAACLQIIDKGAKLDIQKTAAQVSAFANSVREDCPDVDSQRYLVATTQGSNKAANRALRSELLLKHFA